MSNSKYLPSGGFLSVVVTLVLCLSCIHWALSETNGETLKRKTGEGVDAYMEEKNDKAIRLFLEGIEYTKTPKKISMLHRLIATASSGEEKTKHFKIAYTNDPTNADLLWLLKQNNLYEEVVGENDSTQNEFRGR
ncbi:MAG: hypothetical protein BA863_00645 [Desulfovibrio sp. S3730MH75]|nr:MAG: hypothetical protein BA863_00645 [Desulfovibrio sp. S3730MH75]